MIKIGTSGFSFPDWKGTIYPESLKDREMLPFYEKELGLKALEINFTYYTLPSQKSFSSMLKKTSKDFEFAVKSYKGMTHEIRDPTTGDIMDRQEIFKKFKQSLLPLMEEGRLACVLAQFPYGFFPNPSNVDYLKRFREEMDKIPLIFEFRNRKWLREGTFQFLRQNGIGFCVVDEPKLPKLMPYVPRATSEIGYFRFHGRNPNWFNVPTSVRYDYLYSEEELKGFIPDIKEVSQKTTKTLVFFNNCHAGSAAKNAVQMARLLNILKMDGAQGGKKGD
ncbi:MAG: DUF72 domain-containing protein [Thermodesulfobacteriota bacterium]